MKSIWLRFKDGGKGSPELRACLVKALEKRQFRVDLNDAAPRENVDLCMCVGGDGTLLSTIRRLGDRRFDVPVLGIHQSGGLGFLYSIQADEALQNQNSGEALNSWCEKLASDLAAENYVEEKRFGLSLAFPEFQNHQGPVHWAMNDFVFAKSGSLSRMVYMRVWVDGNVLLARMRGDGLIVSSSTGSTGYSLSAGGPVVDPRLDAILLNPVCPHEVAQRPIVLAGDASIRIELLEVKSSECVISSDGQEKIEAGAQKFCEIRRAERPVRWIRMAHPELNPRSYFEQLRSKLRYGGE